LFRIENDSLSTNAEHIYGEMDLSQSVFSYVP